MRLLLTFIFGFYLTTAVFAEKAANEIENQSYSSQPAVQSLGLRPISPLFGYSKNNLLLNTADEAEPYTESKIRRIEIIFILAAPFVLLAHAAVVGVIYYAGSNRDGNFNLSAEALGFLGASSLITTIAITYYDYKQNWPDPEKEKEKGDAINLGYSYRF